MTYHGRNFDIVTGVTALAVAALLASGRVPPRLVSRVVGGWNAMGAALLVNVVGVALLSAPTPFRSFHNEPANVWVTRAPWVWLPTVMVVAAVLGHVLVYRRLRAQGGGLARGAPEALPTPARSDVAK
jgi:drug/metabolite transporter (DMT)-like permease